MTNINARRRGRRSALLGATVLAGLSPALATAAAAAQFSVAVQQVADPLMSGLQIPPNAAQVGMWGPLQTWPLIAIHAALLPSGKMVTYGTPQGQSVQDGRTYDVWDPTQGFGAGHTVLPGTTAVNSFCAAQALTPDGTLMSSGGIFNGSQDKGSAVINAAANGVSALTYTMADDRYYASMITQADGSQIILGGTYPYAAGWANPTASINAGQNTGMTPEVFRKGQGWTSLFGATSRDAFGPDNSRYWYPRAWVAPNGKVFGVSSDNAWYLDSSGNGSLTYTKFKPGPTAVGAPGTSAPNTGPGSTAVMYDKGKILQVGGNSMTNGDGSNYASSLATVFDITGSNVSFKDTAPMTFPRDWATATVLPTGKVLVTGGSTFGDTTGPNAIRSEETWDPATGQWTTGPAEAAYRGYHSLAVLLQDGAVILSGGGVPGPVSNFNAQVYYPPYLFTAANSQSQLAQRPKIVSMNTNVPAYAQSLQVEVSSNAAIAQVVLVGLSQITHSFNSGQRRDPLTFTQNGNVLTVRAPASGGEAPPGYYQLIAIDANGVPSPGAIVGLGSGVVAPGTTATPVQSGNNSVSVGATASAVAAPATGGYTQIGQYVQRIATGADGTTVSVNYYDNTVWMYNSDNNWTRLPWQMKTVAVRNARSVWGIGMDNVIWRFDGTSWTQVGVNGSTISIAADGTVAITNLNNEIWYKTADDTQANWIMIPNSKAKRVAVMSAKVFYTIGFDNNLYRSDAYNNVAQVGQNVSDVAVAADGTVMTIYMGDQTIWQKVTDDNAQVWTQLPQQWKAVSIAAAGAGRAVVVGIDQRIWRY